MNKERRNQIDEIIENLNGVSEEISSLLTDVDSLKGDAEADIEEMDEEEAEEQSQQAIKHLNAAISAIEGIGDAEKHLRAAIATGANAMEPLATTSILESLAALKERVADIHSEAVSVRDDEQEYFDNMPESFQGGDRGMAAEEAITNLEDAISGLEDMDFDYVTNALENAKE